MPTLGNFKHGGKLTGDSFQSRGRRYKARLSAKLHAKKLTGTHFLRMANFDDITSQQDTRIYLDENQAPFTLESATAFLDVFLQARSCHAAQLFAKDGTVVKEHLGGLYAGALELEAWFDFWVYTGAVLLVLLLVLLLLHLQSKLLTCRRFDVK